jgi:hypothetical protein
MWVDGTDVKLSEAEPAMSGKKDRFSARVPSFDEH